MPIWIPGVSGSVASGSLKVDSDKPPINGADLFADLSFAFVGQVDVRRGRWGLSLDGFYVSVSAGADFTLFDGALEGDADGDLRAGIARARITYLYSRATAPWQVRRCGCAEHRLYAGARFYDAGIRATSIGIATLNENAFWADPIIGLESLYPFSRKLAFLFRGDVGGFGVGSRFSWSLMGALQWRFHRRWALTVGYSWLDFRRVSGSGSDDVTWDLSLHGPLVGLSFRI